MEERDKQVIDLMQQSFGAVPSKMSKGAPQRIASESERVLQQYRDIPSERKTSPISERQNGYGLIGDSVDTYVDAMLYYGKPKPQKGVGENVGYEINKIFGEDANVRFYQAAQKMNPEQKKLFADFLQALGGVSDLPIPIRR